MPPLAILADIPMTVAPIKHRPATTASVDLKLKDYPASEGYIPAQTTFVKTLSQKGPGRLTQFDVSHAALSLLGWPSCSSSHRPGVPRSCWLAHRQQKSLALSSK